MREIYIFYADVYILQNLCMDYIALAGVNCFLKRRVKLRKLFLISLLASVGSLILHIYIANVVLRTLLLHFVLNTGMTLFSFGWSKKRAFLENWMLIYLTILFLGGIMEWENRLGISAASFWIKAVGAAVILSVVTVYLQQKRDFMEQIFRVDVVHHGKTWELTGYWDSGNLLVDPYVGKPVNILQEKLAKQIFCMDSDYMRLIPYCSLGNTNGLLSVYNAEKMRIYQGKKQVEIAPAVFGVAETGLLEHREYDLILQATMLEKER